MGGSVTLVWNKEACGRPAYPFGQRLSVAAARSARSDLRQCPRYEVTPLVALEGAASRAGVAKVYYKDEAGRFGLGSFKAVGAGYAMARILAAEASRALNRPISPSQLFAPEVRTISGGITFCCASDGNHGRAVAAAAQAFGAECVIFLHAEVSRGREEAISALGARVVRTEGNYDRSVRIARAEAASHGWTLVADTSDEEDDRVALLIMQGYAAIGLEIVEQLEEAEDALPTHLFLQGGVGGLAAALIAFFWEYCGEEAPVFVIVEPEGADCLSRSAAAGEPQRVPGSLTTLMAGLACGEVSRTAWPIIQSGAEYFVTIADEMAVSTMRELADGALGSTIVAGESGAAGLAGFLALAASAEQVRLGPDSRILVIGTEGATDPEIYRRLVQPEVVAS